MVDETRTDSYVRQAPFIEERQKRLLELAQGRMEGAIPASTFDIKVASPSELQAASYGTGRGIGQYQGYLGTGAGTTGTGVSQMLAGRGQIGDAFTAGAGTLAGATTGLQGMTGDPLQGEAAQVARGAAQGFDPTSVSAYMNPYEDMAVQQALGDISRQGDIARNRLSGQAVQAGAFGGARQGLQEAELGRNILEQQARTATGMRQSGYQQAMGMAQQAQQQQQQRQLQQAQMLSGIGGLQGTQAIQRAQTLGQLGSGLAGIGAGQSQEAIRLGQGLGGLGAQQANIAGMGQNLLSQQATLQSQLGAQQQAQTQREFDAQRAAGMQQAYEPFQRMGWFSDILKPTVGTAASTIGMSTAPSPSMLSQLVGAGITGLGVAKYLSPGGNLFGGAATK
jgi:hypothetical protein